MHLSLSLSLYIYIERERDCRAISLYVQVAVFSTIQLKCHLEVVEFTLNS